MNDFAYECLLLPVWGNTILCPFLFRKLVMRALKRQIILSTWNRPRILSLKFYFFYMAVYSDGAWQVLRDSFVCRWEIWPYGMGDGIIEWSIRSVKGRFCMSLRDLTIWNGWRDYWTVPQNNWTISLLELLQILTIFPNLVFNNHFGNTLILSLLCFYTDIGWTSWSICCLSPVFLDLRYWLDLKYLWCFWNILISTRVIVHMRAILCSLFLFCNWCFICIDWRDNCS